MVFTSFQNSWNSHPCPHQLVFWLLQHAFFRPWGAQSTCSPPWEHGCKVHFSSSLQRHNTHGVSICQLLFFWNSSLKLFIFISQDPKDYSQLTYYGEVSPHYCSALLRSTSTIHLQDFKMHGTVPPLASSVVALPASLKLLKTVLCHESWRELHWLCNCNSYPPWSKKKRTSPWKRCICAQHPFSPTTAHSSYRLVTNYLHPEATETWGCRSENSLKIFRWAKSQLSSLIFLHLIFP